MKKTEICLHCYDDYVPKRRGVQKFCSNSCRSSNWKLKQEKTKELNKIKVPKINLPATNEQENMNEKMSLAGVGNAAVGVAAVDIIKNVFTPNEKKPATKKDIAELKALIKGRYLPVKNIEKDIYGRLPYYEVITGNVVYY